MKYLLAHAGEVHESAVEATTHSMPWYLQIILFILIGFGLYTILGFFIKKKDVVLLILATLMLIAGFGFYSIAPIVSVVAITLGLFSALLVTLTGLSTPRKDTGGK